jgi:hypothetical protein
MDIVKKCLSMALFSIYMGQVVVYNVCTLFVLFSKLTQKRNR